MKTAKQTIVQVPFNETAEVILSAQKKADGVALKTREVIKMALQQFIDLCFMANGRTEDACKAMQTAIMESEIVSKSVAIGTMERTTWTEYANGAARALYFNVPFAASLKNDNDYKLPWSKKRDTKGTAKSGKVETTDRAELDKTLTKALKQARLLGLTDFAANVLDLCIDSLDEFKEAE